MRLQPRLPLALLQLQLWWARRLLPAGLLRTGLGEDDLRNHHRHQQQQQQHARAAGSGATAADALAQGNLPDDILQPLLLTRTVSGGVTSARPAGHPPPPAVQDAWLEAEAALLDSGGDVKARQQQIIQPHSK